MGYYIGQFFGLLSMVCCLVLPMLKRKQDMLLIAVINNSLAIANVLLISGWGSAIMVCAVGVVQALVAIVHVRKASEVKRSENLLFLVLYIGCGLLGFRTAIDVLPIVGAVFNMLATFQRDEQRTRWLLLCNASVFAVYYLLIRSTNILSCGCAIVSAVMGLWRYRKKTANT